MLDMRKRLPYLSPRLFALGFSPRRRNRLIRVVSKELHCSLEVPYWLETQNAETAEVCMWSYMSGW